jgi:hypothetical protein
MRLKVLLKVVFCVIKVHSSVFQKFMNLHAGVESEHTANLTLAKSAGSVPVNCQRFERSTHFFSNACETSSGSSMFTFTCIPLSTSILPV